MPSESYTPTTDLQPSSPSPPVSASPSSPAPTWQQTAFTTASSTALALYGISKAFTLAEKTLRFLSKPNGEIATDVICWAPLGLVLLAVVAIASPVSLGPILGTLRALLPGSRKDE